MVEDLTHGTGEHRATHCADVAVHANAREAPQYVVGGAAEVGAPVDPDLGFACLPGFEVVPRTVGLDSRFEGGSALLARLQACGVSRCHLRNVARLVKSPGGSPAHPVAAPLSASR